MTPSRPGGLLRERWAAPRREGRRGKSGDAGEAAGPGGACSGGRANHEWSGGAARPGSSDADASPCATGTVPESPRASSGPGRSAPSGSARARGRRRSAHAVATTSRVPPTWPIPARPASSVGDGPGRFRATTLNGFLQGGQVLDRDLVPGHPAFAGGLDLAGEAQRERALRQSACSAGSDRPSDQVVTDLGEGELVEPEAFGEVHHPGEVAAGDAAEVHHRLEQDRRPPPTRTRWCSPRGSGRASPAWSR